MKILVSTGQQLSMFTDSADGFGLSIAYIKNKTLSFIKSNRTRAGTQSLRRGLPEAALALRLLTQHQVKRMFRRERTLLFNLVTTGYYTPTPAGSSRQLINAPRQLLRLGRHIYKNHQGF